VEALPKAEGSKILSSRIEELLAHAAQKDIPVALEPEPGMFIETMDDFRRAADGLRAPGIRLTLDVGHAHITERETVAEVVRECGQDIVNVHLDDARGGRHEHLPLGEGEIDFPGVLQALAGIGKELFLSVELSRHGHDAVNQARRSIAFLKGIVKRLDGVP
jgi:sugar phosphate isomerase/epimerase